jgi:hypothetical protein
MSRGDLTTAQWERLQPLLPPQKPRLGRPAHNHRPILNAASVSCALAPPGVICPSATAPGAPWPAASIAGSGLASGSAALTPSSRRPLRLASATGCGMLSMAPSAVPPSLRRAPNKGSRRRSLRPQSGRLQSPHASARRGPWHALHVAVDAGAVP